MYQSRYELRGASFALSLLGLFVLPVLLNGPLSMGAAGCRGTRRAATRLLRPTRRLRRRRLFRSMPPARFRGAGFLVHTWIAVKPSGSQRFCATRCWVLASPTARRRFASTGPARTITGSAPGRRSSSTGADRVDAVIENIRAAVASYPYPQEYRAWPGPNSNTFTAFIAREVPELGLDLPSTRSEKIFCPGALFAAAPSGTGFQVSLWSGRCPLAVGDGFEVNLLGLNIGVDAAVPALKLPAIGRLGLER